MIWTPSADGTFTGLFRALAPSASPPSRTSCASPRQPASLCVPSHATRQGSCGAHALRSTATMSDSEEEVKAGGEEAHAEQTTFESADAGASHTFPQTASAVRKGGFMVIKGRPCKARLAAPRPAAAALSCSRRLSTSPPPRPGSTATPSATSWRWTSSPTARWRSWCRPATTWRHAGMRLRAPPRRAAARRRRPSALAHDGCCDARAAREDLSDQRDRPDRASPETCFPAHTRRRRVAGAPRLAPGLFAAGHLRRRLCACWSLR